MNYAEQTLALANKFAACLKKPRAKKMKPQINRREIDLVARYQVQAREYLVRKRVEVERGWIFQGDVTRNRMTMVLCAICDKPRDVQEFECPYCFSTHILSRRA